MADTDGNFWDWDDNDDDQDGHDHDHDRDVTHFADKTIDSLAVQTATDPHPGSMWFGSGNAPTNYNITDLNDQNVELGLKLHVRGGADYTPVSVDHNGTAHYDVASGVQNATHAMWNFDYVVDTGLNNSAKTLANFDFQMVFTELAGDHKGASATFELDPATHIWFNVADHSSGFGGDDFNTPASANVESKVAENSENLGFSFFTSVFGPLTSSTAAGTKYEISLEAFEHGHHGHGDLLASVHDILTLV